MEPAIYDAFGRRNIDLVRHVRTPAGAKFFHLPIGSPIGQKPVHFKQTLGSLDSLAHEMHPEEVDAAIAATKHDAAVQTVLKSFKEPKPPKKPKKPKAAAADLWTTAMYAAYGADKNPSVKGYMDVADGFNMAAAAYRDEGETEQAKFALKHAATYVAKAQAFKEAQKHPTKHLGEPPVPKLNPASTKARYHIGAVKTRPAIYEVGNWEKIWKGVVPEGTPWFNINDHQEEARAHSVQIISDAIDKQIFAGKSPNQMKQVWKDWWQSYKPPDEVVLWHNRYGYHMGMPDAVDYNGGRIVDPETYPDEFRRGLATVIANDAVQAWSESSNDTDVKILAIQARAAQRFGIAPGEYSPWYSAASRDLPEFNARNSDLLNVIIDSQYQATQKRLKATGLKSLIVVRGMVDEPKKTPDGAYIMRPLTSWSLNKLTAEGFGNKMFQTEVPIEKVFSMPGTGFGVLNEQEVVVIGGNIHANL